MEFQIFICDVLNKHQEKTFISDEQAFAAYQELYESHQKFMDDTPASNLDYFIQNHLIPLGVLYPEYEENVFNFESWRLNKDPRFNEIWYMTKEVKEELIKCAEIDKENAQNNLDSLRSNSNEFAIISYEDSINDLEIEINDCDKLIENLNYYYDRKMLLFFKD